MRLNSVKAFLQQQIRGVAAKQDECLAQQAQMKAELGHVAQDVQHTRGEVSEVRRSSRNQPTIAMSKRDSIGAGKVSSMVGAM